MNIKGTMMRGSNDTGDIYSASYSVGTPDDPKIEAVKSSPFSCYHLELVARDLLPPPLVLALVVVIRFSVY